MSEKQYIQPSDTFDSARFGFTQVERRDQCRYILFFLNVVYVDE